MKIHESAENYLETILMLKNKKGVSAFAFTIFCAIVLSFWYEAKLNFIIVVWYNSLVKNFWEVLYLC